MTPGRYSADVRWSDEDHGWVATCPEFDDLSAVADSRLDAIRELESAVEAAAEVYADEGWPLPEPAVHASFSGQFRVRLPRSLHGWLAREAQREGVSLNTFVIARLAEARGGSQHPAGGTSRGNPPENSETAIDERRDTATMPPRRASHPRARKAAHG